MATKTPKPKTPTPNRKPKKKKASGPWSRLKTSPLLHWTTRLTSPGTKSPISTKSLQATAATLEEAARLSVALDLMKGQSTPSLQKAFDTTSGSLLKEFQELYPEYVFKIGGRQPKSLQN